MSFIFTLVLLGIAGYVLYSTITGQGRLFATDNIKEDQVGAFLKLIRPLYGVLGGLLLLMALLSGYQNAVFSENVYRFTDDFRTYFADQIAPDGSIKDTGANVNEVYGYTKMASVFQKLEQPTVPEGVTPNYAEALTDANGDYVFLGVGETEQNQNETFAKLRGVLSYKASRIVNWMLMGLAAATVVFLFVLMNRFTDKEKAAKAKEKARQSGSQSMPSSAFEFDEEQTDGKQE